MYLELYPIRRNAPGRCFSLRFMGSCVFVASGSDEITPGNVSLLHVCESRTVTRFTEFEKLA